MPKNTASAPEPSEAPDATPTITNLPRVPLHYVGTGDFLPGVPANDLDAIAVADLAPETYAAAVASGLYAPNTGAKET